MSSLYGFIGEDNSDVDAFEVILSKYIPKEKFRLKRFVGKGHGKISAKVKAWTEILLNEGCKAVFIVQDLDEYKFKDLKKSLEEKIKSLNTKNNILVIIPIKELEAWLLTDPKVLQDVFNFLSLPKLPSNPEQCKDPKKEIADIVRKYRQNHRIIYTNTSHNKEILEKLSLISLRKCSSFEQLHRYLELNLNGKKKIRKKT